jgi:hypothetical protein
MLEQWKSVVGYEGHYEISDLGRVKSVSRWAWNGVGWHRLRERLRTQHINKHGYPAVNLCKNNKMKTFVVYQLVTRAFLGEPPPGFEVAHEDGVRTNSLLANLSYKTRVDNHADKKRHGTNSCGSKRYNAKLTETDVEDIHTLSTLGVRNFKLAEEFSVSPVVVCQILKHQKWKHVT